MILGDLLGQILVDDSAAGFLAVAVQFFDKFREELILPELPECLVFCFYMFIRNIIIDSHSILHKSPAGITLGRLRTP